MFYKENCRYFNTVNNNCYCNAGKITDSGCSPSCSMFELRNNINSLYQKPGEITKNTSRQETKYSHDKSMKGLLKFTNFTGFLLSRVIKELEGISLEEFKRCTGGREFLGQESTEYGSPETKDIRLDLVIEYDNSGELRLRIDTEPQTSQESYSEERDESYSLIARAVYYGAVLLATELQTEEEYHKIRKVYSVWICYERPVPGIREPVLRYSMQPEKEYRYCTKDKSGRDSIYTNRHKFDDGDLISIIMISVKDIENAVRSGKDGYKGEYNFDVLNDLNLLLSTNITNEERFEFYAKQSIDKGGSETVTVFEKSQMEIRTQADMITAQKNEIAAQANMIILQKNEIAAQNDMITAQNDKITAQNDKITAQNDKITAQNDKIAELISKIAELEAILNSR